MRGHWQSEEKEKSIQLAQRGTAEKKNSRKKKSGGLREIRTKKKKTPDMVTTISITQNTEF